MATHAPRGRGRWVALGIGGALALALGAYLPATLLAAAPTATATVTAAQPLPVQAVDFPLPPTGVGGIARLDTDEVIWTYEAERRYPIASLTKIVTAFAILEKHPLAAGPVLLMNRVVLTAHDGTLLVVDQP